MKIRIWPRDPLKDSMSGFAAILGAMIEPIGFVSGQHRGTGNGTAAIRKGAL